MLKFLLKILLDEDGVTLSITRKTANTLITAAGFNTNYSEVEAVVNALTAANYAADSVGATALNSDVVRSGYGLVQHTDGSLYVDVSDTNPCLEISDGGLRVKVDGSSVTRTASGLVAATQDHGALSGLTDDDHTQYLLKSGSIASITTRDHDLLAGLSDNDHPQYVRGQSNNMKIDSGSVTITDDGTTAVTFSFTFASAPKVVLTINSYDSFGAITLAAESITTTGFTARQSSGPITAVTCSWIAIGTPA